MFRTKFAVRYSETDQMGVVHHSRYFPWFEAARTDFFQASGYSYAQVEKDGVLLPLVDCYCKFLTGAQYGDDVIIEIALTKVGVAKCVFEYRVLRGKDEMLLATGYTTHGFTDHDFRPLNIKKVNPEVYQKLLQMKEADA